MPTKTELNRKLYKDKAIAYWKNLVDVDLELTCSFHLPAKHHQERFAELAKQTSRGLVNITEEDGDELFDAIYAKLEKELDFFLKNNNIKEILKGEINSLAQRYYDAMTGTVR